MANLDTTQIAHDLLGSSELVYQQDLPSPLKLSPPHHLKIDKLGAGDFIFVDSAPAGQNPAHSFDPKGLLTKVERSATAPQTENQGHFAAVNGQNFQMPGRFVLTATFIEPKQVSLIANQPPLGTYAPAVLLSFGTAKLTGATSKFQGTGQSLNAKGIAVPIKRPDIDGRLSNKVKDPNNPVPFTLVLHVVRSAADSDGDVMLFVGDHVADSFHFTFGNGLTSATVFDILVGIGTANGTNYSASVFITKFEIWAPQKVKH